MKGDEICLTGDMIGDIISAHFGRRMIVTQIENFDDCELVPDTTKLVLIMEDVEWVIIYL